MTVKSTTNNPVRARDVWRGSRAYRRLATSFAVSGIGDWMFGLALSVWVLERTHAPVWVSAMIVARMAPYALLGMYGGAVADRFDRRQILIVFDAVRALLLAGMAIVVATRGPVVVGILLAVLVSVATVPYRPAVAATTPRLVADEHLGVANSIEAAISQTVVFAGPALGAVALVIASPAVVFGFDACTFALSMLLVWRLPGDVPAGCAGAERPSWTKQIGDGWAAVRVIPGALPLLVLIGASVVGYGASLVDFVFLVSQRFGLPASSAGYLACASALGGACVAGYAGRLASRARAGPVFGAAMMLIAGPFVVLGFVHSPLLALVACGIGGAGSVIFDVVGITWLQRNVPAALLGRVLGIQDTIIGIGTLVGAGAAAIALRATDAATTIRIVGLALTVLTLCLARPLHHVSRSAHGRDSIAPDVVVACSSEMSNPSTVSR